MALKLEPVSDEAVDEAVYDRDLATRARPYDKTAFDHAFRQEVATVQDNVRIHYVVGGDGPLVVLLHG
jgi:hypothetical protein